MPVTMPPLGADAFLIPLRVAGAVSATTPNAVRFRAPCAVALWGVSAVARTTAGAAPVCAIDVKVAGSSLLTAPLAVAAANPADGAIKTPARVADEAVVSIDVTIDGADTVVTDIDILLTLVRTA